MACIKAMTTNPEAKDMAVDMAKGNEVPNKIIVVPSQEDLVESVEPSIHPSGAPPSGNHVIIVKRKDIFQILL